MVLEAAVMNRRRANGETRSEFKMSPACDLREAALPNA
jgi:hypothetical protein